MNDSRCLLSVALVLAGATLTFSLAVRAQAQTLFQGTDGGIYGTTLYGPDPCCAGTIFRLSNAMGRLVKTVPVAGSVGNSVLILGNRLTGGSSVTFNGVEAKFAVESDTYIKATVPWGAKTDTVSVLAASGTLNSNPQFVLTK